MYLTEVPCGQALSVEDLQQLLQLKDGVMPVLGLRARFHVVFCQPAVFRSFEKTASNLRSRSKLAASQWMQLFLDGRGMQQCAVPMGVVMVNLLFR